MPIFQPRNRTQILRDMIARVVARSDLTGLSENSGTFQVLAAAAAEDAEQYFQMARLRDLFAIDRATGSDLDERAAEILPGTLSRLQPLGATTQVEFSRPGTTGTIPIPAGTVIAAEDAEGDIRYRTTTSGSILAGSTTSALIDVVALTRGVRGNVAGGQINKIISRIAGITGVTNPSAVSNGRDRESDEDFRARLKAFVQSLSRGTITALESFSANVILSDGRRVLFSNVVEPAVPDGTVTLYIDDGTGQTDEFTDAFVGTDDTIVSSATGGERELFSSLKPIRDFIELRVNAVLQVEGVDFTLNRAAGKFILSNASYPTGLTAADVVTAQYRAYTGLIAQTQLVIDGDPANPLTFPGVRAAGVLVFVRPAQAIFQTLDGVITVQEGFDSTTVAFRVREVIQGYINSLNIGEPVIVAEIIERAMGVTGMFNFRINDLSGSSPATDQIILDTQVARITSGDITLI